MASVRGSWHRAPKTLGTFLDDWSVMRLITSPFWSHLSLMRCLRMEAPRVSRWGWSLERPESRWEGGNFRELATDQVLRRLQQWVTGPPGRWTPRGAGEVPAPTWPLQLCHSPDPESNPSQWTSKRIFLNFFWVPVVNYRDKAMAPHSSTLAWKIPWTEEEACYAAVYGVGHDWATSLSLFTFMHWRGKWQPTPVFFPGESRDGGAWWASVYGVTQSWTRKVT